jgi:hypothetical protein
MYRIQPPVSFTQLTWSARTVTSTLALHVLPNPPFIHFIQYSPSMLFPRKVNNILPIKRATLPRISMGAGNHAVALYGAPLPVIITLMAT